MVDFFHLHTYISTHMYICMNVCVCAHLHTCALTVVKTWINGRPIAFLYTLLPNAAYTHTYQRASTHTSIQLRFVQNRLQPQFNPKKKRCQPGALLSSLSSARSLTLCLVLFLLCIAYLEARSADCSCSRLSSLSLSCFLPHPKGILFSFPFPLSLSLSFHVSSAVFGFCLCLSLLQGVSLFCFVLTFFGYFASATHAT